MPPRSAAYKLPPEVRAELDRRLVASGFGAYRRHAAWLRGLGHQISKSAVAVYGEHLRAKYEPVYLASLIPPKNEPRD